MWKRVSCGVFAAALLVLVASCGGGSSSSSSTPAPTSSGQSTATFTISGRAVSPKTATIARGERVTFVNNDTVAHTMSSDPHPVHTDCPALNMGTMSPGTSRDSSTLNTARVCGFHDHDDPDNAALKGSVTVQ